MVLGAILEHPEEQFEGYLGDEPVVWSGMTLHLAAEK